MARCNYISNFNEDIESFGYLRPYLRVYDEKDIILFSSKYKNEYRILSNFWASSVPLPWRGKYYNSVEQMIISSFIEDNCNPKYHDEMVKVLEMIHNCKDGKEVKNNMEIQKLYKKVRKETIEKVGEENWDLQDWKVSRAAIKVKYDYCPEFREVVDANKDKFFCEDSYWKEFPKAGVLKVTDESSPFFGKYIGANYTGIAIQMCVNGK